MNHWQRVLKFAEIAIGLLLFPAVIAYLNFQLIYPQFLGEFTQHLGSIEVSYITMAKFVKEYGLSWQPLWYFGYPMHVFYTPLLPFLEVLSKVIFGWSYSHAYRFLTGTAYVLAPVSLYFFVWYLTKRQIGGLVAAFCYSFLPSAFAFLLTSVRADFLTAELEPRRYTNLVRWGEGPHTFSIFFIPLAALFFLWLLRSGKFKACLLASIFIVLTGLTNAVGLWAVALFCLSLVMGELVGGNRFGEVAKQTAKTVLISVGLAFFWYNPVFLKTFFREGGGTVASFGQYGFWGLLGLAFLTLIFFFLVKLIFGKLTKFLPGFPHSLFWLTFLFVIVYVYYASGESRIEIVPQALRLNTEADMAASILFGVLVSGLVGLVFKLKFSGSRIFAWSFYIFFGALLLLPLVLKAQNLAKVTPEATWSLEATGKKLEQTAEYQTAVWFEKNTLPGTRVVAPGNYSFFLNYFVNVPQLRGALYQSSTHFWPDHIYYQLANGEDADISLAWLKIGNISNLVYTTGGSGEMYKDYKVSAEKFDSTLNRIEEKNGDIYYQVPLKNPIPAKVVDLSKISSLSTPYNAIDKKAIFSYLAWMEEKSDRKLDFRQIKNDQYQISGQVGKGEGILVQMTYDPGWQAKLSDGIKVKIKKDPLGFIVIEPKVSGEQTIILQYSQPWLVIFSWLVTILTIVGLVIWSIFVSRRSKVRDEKKENPEQLAA